MGLSKPIWINSVNLLRLLMSTSMQKRNFITRIIFKIEFTNSCHLIGKNHCLPFKGTSNHRYMTEVYLKNQNLILQFQTLDCWKMYFPRQGKHSIVNKYITMAPFCLSYLNPLTFASFLKSDSHLPKKFIFICFNKSLLKMVKNAFYFILKVLFVFKIFKFLSWHFGHVEEPA